MGFLENLFQIYQFISFILMLFSSITSNNNKKRLYYLIYRDLKSNYSKKKVPKKFLMWKKDLPLQTFFNSYTYKLRLNISLTWKLKHLLKKEVLIAKSSDETGKCTLSIRKTLSINKDKVNQGIPLIASFSKNF